MHSLKDLVDRIRGESLRLVERLLPLSLLRLLLWPAAAFLAARELVIGGPTFRQFDLLPPSFRPPLARGRWLWRLWCGRIAINMTRFLRLWPDRLQEPRWREQCRIQGVEKLDALRAGSRPVILATLHTANLTELCHWLRSRGLIAAILAYLDVDKIAPYRKHLSSLGDKAGGLTGIPRLIGVNRLWDAREFLARPQSFLIHAMDHPRSRRPLPFRGNNFCFVIESGAFRLAAITGAVVVPCLIRSRRGLTSEIYLGDPVPDEYVVDSRRHASAGEHVLQRLLPLVQANTEQCEVPLISSFRSMGENGQM